MRTIKLTVIINAKLGERWTLKERKHRMSGPAFTLTKFAGQWWFQHDHYHRLNGPAVGMPGKVVSGIWHLNGCWYKS